MAAEADRSPWTRWWPLAAAGAALAAWVIAYALMTGRGFDITDEGFYVLSYRWWDSNPRAFTGAQYLYGPVFDALGESIRGLRFFRLGTILLVGTLFAFCFVGWLESRQGRLPAPRRAAAIVALVASAGVVVAWLPLTPGYNDLAALGALASAGLVLAAAARVTTGRAVPWILPLATGAAVAVQLVGRWSSASVVLLLVLGIVTGLAPAGRRPTLVHLARTAAGSFLTLLALDLLVHPLDDAFRAIRRVNALAAAEASGIGPVVGSYLSDTGDVLVRASLVGAPVIVVAVVLRLRATSRPSDIWWAVAAVACSTALVVEVDGFRGGAAHAHTFISSLVAFLLPLLVLGVRRFPWAEAGPLLMLTGLPLAQAAGTNNSVWLVALSACPAWVAVAIWISRTYPPRSPARWLATGCSGALIALITVITVTGVLLYPYRTSAFASDTTPVPSLGGIAVDARTADQLDAAARELGPFVADGRSGILALDTMSGLIYVTGGRAAGEPWTGSSSLARSAALFLDACRAGEFGPDNPPVLLLNRALTSRDRATLAACGLDLDQDFREADLSGAPPGVTALVPR